MHLDLQLTEKSINKKFILTAPVVLLPNKDKVNNIKLEFHQNMTLYFIIIENYLDFIEQQIS